MVVDFAIKRFSGCRVASLTYVGPYRGPDMMRSEFGQIVKWAREKGAKTGRWFFIEHDAAGAPDKKRRWEACVEIKDRVRSGKGIRMKEMPASLVATVKFDPDRVSPRVVYHGLEGWLEWRKRAKEYRWAGEAREVYRGDPWTSKKAWANTEIQVPIQRM